MWIVALVAALAATGGCVAWVLRGWRAADERPWWSRLGKVGAKCAGGAGVILLISRFGDTAPAPARVVFTVLLAVFALAAILAWTTASWVDPARKGPPWWLVGAWLAGGLIGAWFVGFPASYLNNVPTYNADGNLVLQVLRPLIHGAWFAVVVWLIGYAHVRWLRQVRARLVAAQDLAEFEDEMRA